LKDILPLYNKYKYCQNAYIVGCGSGAKKFNPHIVNNHIVIALNRGIEFTKWRTDILFVDRPFSLKAVKQHIKGHVDIAMPIWSRPPGTFNFTTICGKLYKQIYYYSWGYLNERLLDKSADYPLDLIQLYIGWGVSNSAVNFVTRLPKIEKVLLYGCDGKPNNYVKQQCRTTQAQKRRLQQYKLSKDHLDKILIKAGVEHEYL
jgi:hypothetical protein